MSVNFRRRQTNEYTTLSNSDGSVKIYPSTMKQQLFGRWIMYGFVTLFLIAGVAGLIVGGIALGKISNLTANTTPELIMTNQIMYSNSLAHIADGIISPNYLRQTLAANASANGMSINQISGMPLQNFTSNAIVPSGQSLNFKAVGSCWYTRDLASDPYTSASDSTGSRVIQLGYPEAWGRQGTPGSGSKCPSPSSINTLEMFTPGIAGQLVLKLRFGTEFGYDFVSVRKNKNTIYSNSGAGPNAISDAFIEETLTIDMTSADSVTISYAPDGVYWGGYDIVYFQASFTSVNSLHMTIPSNLTAYVGKDIQICSQDTGSHIIELVSNGTRHFDNQGQWPVLQFQGNGRDACCAVISVIADDRLSIKSRDACTVFCDSANLYHCVDPLRPYETSPYHGYWRQATKTFRPGSYAFIDASKNPASLLQYGGTVNFPTERTVGGQVMYPQSFGTFSSSTSPDISSNYDFPQVITFQPGAQQAIVYFGYDKDATDVHNRIFEVYVKTGDRIPPLVTISSGTLTDRSPDDPVQMLRNYFDTLLYAYYSSLNADEKWIGFLPAKALLEEIIATGKNHSQPIIKTLVSMSFNPEEITEFRTSSYHHVAPPARVHVSGFVGDCAAMNSPPEGHLVAVGATNNIPLPSPLFEDYGPDPNNRTVHHKIGVYLDSSSVPVFPGTNTANCTGSNPVISVSYGPITSNTNYIRTIGALNYWFYEAIKVGVHCRPFFFYDADTTVPRSNAAYPREEWSDVVSDALAGLSSDPFTQKNMATRVDSTTSVFYRNSVLQGISMRLASSSVDRRILAGSFDLTGRFGIRGDRESSAVLQTDNFMRATHGYNIGIQNYLEEVKYPSYAIVGTTRSAEPNLVAQLVTPGGGGDEFHVIMVPFGQLPPDNYSYLRTSAPFNGGPSSNGPYNTTTLAFNNALQQLNYYVGRVKTSLTSGIGNIGYIRAGDTSQLDPLSFSIDGAFCPTGLCN